MANVALNIVVGGEEKAKQAIKELNGNIKQLGTNMKSLDEVFAGNQNSYDYLSAKLKNLTETQEAYRKKTQDLPDVIKFLREQQNSLADNTDALKQKMEQATAAYDNAENKTAALKRAMNEATKEFNDNQKALNYARDAANDYQRQLTEAEGKVDILGEEIRKTNGYLKEAAVSADGTATSIDRYGREIKDAGEDTKEFGKAAEVLAQAIVASGAVQGAEKLRDAIVDTAKASIEYESAFAGVRKTVDGTAEELQTISDGIKQMSLEIPMASKELAGIAENAGQLGIATEDVLGFTEVVAALSVTTNLTADQAAVDMARIANITKLTSDEYSNFGSALVALGNDSAAFESEILAMTNRLAAAGSAVGATEAELLGIATTLVSVGIEAEAGGTAVSKLFRQIELAVETGSEKVQQYAEVAGMSATQFAELWRTDVTGALTAFIEGLGGLEEKGQSSIAVLDDMGITEQRLLAAVTALSEAEGLLSKNVELSNTAWAENTALADEAAVRYETTESRIQILNNAFNNLKITVGDELLKTFGGAIDGLTDLTKAADEYVKKNPEVVAGLTAVAAGVGGLAIAGTVIPLVTTLWGLLAANPAGLAVAGILALVTAVATFAATLPDANDDVSVFIRQLDELKERTAETQSGILDLKKANEEQAAAIRGESEEIEKAIKTVEELGNKTDLTASESEILKAAMDKLNGSIPGLKLNYDNLNDSLEDTVYHLRLVASAQALVDEALAKSELRDSYKSYSEQLNKDVADAKKALDDAQTLLDAKKLLEKEFFESRSGDKQTEEARKEGESPWSPYAEDIKLLEEALQDANDAYIVAIGAREANKRQIIEINTEIANLDAQYAEKAAEMKQANTDLFESTEQTAGKAAEVAEESAAAIEQAAAKSETASEKAKTTAQNSQKTIDYIGDAIKQQAKDVKSSLDTLTKEYDNVYNSTKSALDGIGGLFGEVAFKAELSIEDMIRGLETQADYMTGYMQNIQRAAQIGLDEGLIAALSDGSDESAGYIQKIITEFNKLELEYGANSTQAQDFVTRFNNAFKGSETAKDTFAHNVAEMSTDFSARKDEILKDAQTLLDNLKVYSGDSVQEVAEAVWEAVDEVEGSLGSMTEAVKEKGGEAVEAAADVREDVDKEFEGTEEVGEEAGENYVKGLIEGIKKNAPLLVAAGKELADELIQTVSEALDEHSPSKVGEEQGKFYDLGIAKGILDNGYVMVDGALKAIKDLEEASRSAAKAAGESIGGTIASSAAQEAGRALREMAEKGELTYNGNKVGTAASAGIPNLSGQEAADWNAKLKAQYGLPSNWTNQDIVDWLNGGGFMAGGAMPGVSSSGGSVKSSERTPSYLPKTTTQARTTLQKAMDAAVNARVEGIVQTLTLGAALSGVDISNVDVSGAITKAAEEYFQATIEAIESNAKIAGETLSSGDVYERLMAWTGDETIIELMTAAGRTAIEQYIAGMTNAMADGGARLNAQTEETVQDMVDTTSTVLDEHSPSKVGYRQGAFYIQGIAEGEEAKRAELAEKTAEIIEYMRRITDGSAEDAGQSLGITVAESMSASMMAGIKRALSSAQSFISHSGIYESASGKGGGVNVTQYFNTPVQSPYQTKMATQQGIKAVLY